MIIVPKDDGLRYKLAEAMVDLAGMGWFVDTNTWSVFYPMNNHEKNCIPLDHLFDESARGKCKVDWDIAYNYNSWMREMLIDWAQLFDPNFDPKNYEEEDDGDIFLTEGNYLLEILYIELYGHVQNESKFLRFDSKQLAIKWGWNQEKWKEKLLAVEKTWYNNNIEYKKLSIINQVYI